MDELKSVMLYPEMPDVEKENRRNLVRYRLMESLLTQLMALKGDQKLVVQLSEWEIELDDNGKDRGAVYNCVLKVNKEE